MLRLPPQRKPHATFMQPLQCVSQHHVANLHVSTHMATPDDTFQCDLQPPIPKHPITTHAQAHPPKQLEATVTMRQKKKANRPQPQPPHTGGTFQRRLQPLDTEKHKFLCSGFLPNANPMQHSCSHYNVFRSITSQTCTYLRTWQHQMTQIMQPFQCGLQPQIPKHPITTHAQAHPKQLGKIQVFVLRLPPQRKPHATFMQPLQCVSQHHVANLHVSTHMATPDDNNHVAIPLRSATTDSKTPYNHARASTPKAA